ncbi:fatty acid desaturase [Sulfuriflexus sp.]|uniref:DesA family fatty acid desaturase n=1 Tax=Sulfuriflexus sp. TaxID=2015443 RepID=UPI0028CE9E99|nr:fatty acid desaturase [Sulfuriflexus sp.]MDT8405587.1 fatty acid desaturase [Sulfuriflexus sp.]
MLNGLLELSVWGYVAAALILTHITIASVTIFLHRHQAHRALNLHPAVSHFFRFWLWLTTSMVTKEWVAVHRKHHAKCESENDPHSPQILGIDKVLWQGAELYRAEADKQDTLAVYGHNTPDDWLERNLYSGRSNKLGIVLMLVIDVLLFGAAGLTIWAVQMAWIPFWAAGVINGIGHYWGYRDFEVSDASTNIVPIGIIVGGEELHNNHHAFGSSAKFSVKWWEFDIGWMYIRMLSMLGLAKVKKLAPKPLMDHSKRSIDKDTVMALVTNRFQVMSDYARDVMKQVYKEEVRKTRNSALRRQLKRARKCLARNEALIDEKSRMRLHFVLSQNKALDTVYEYKQRLQKIWASTTASQEQLLKDIQEWCRQAEATGINSLQEFARRIKGYSLSPAMSPV